MCKDFGRWLSFNLRYIGKPPWDTCISPPELHEFIDNHNPGRALDLGAGTGTNMLTLARAGWQVEGVEYALIAACQARRKLKRECFSPRVYVRSVTNLDFLDGSFDLILDIGCYHTLEQEDRKIYQYQVIRLLANVGTLLIYAFLKTRDSTAGISAQEIETYKENLKLMNKNEGLDHETSPSVWLNFRKV